MTAINPIRDPDSYAYARECAIDVRVHELMRDAEALAEHVFDGDRRLSDTGAYLARHNKLGPCMRRQIEDRLWPVAAREIDAEDDRAYYCDGWSMPGKANAEDAT